MRKFYIVLGLALISLSIQAQEVQLNGKPVKLQIQGLQLIDDSAQACDVYYCDSADTDCDGVLDEVCPGLEYKCAPGGITDAYMEAAFTGQCTDQTVDPCKGLTLGGICEVD